MVLLGINVTHLFLSTTLCSYSTQFHEIRLILNFYFCTLLSSISNTGIFFFGLHCCLKTICAVTVNDISVGLLKHLLDINHCCGIFTTLHKRKAHYSRVHSTLVPSVACQTTEVTYSFPSFFLPTGYTFPVQTTTFLQH